MNQRTRLKRQAKARRDLWFYSMLRPSKARVVDTFNPWLTRVFARAGRQVFAKVIKHYFY